MRRREAVTGSRFFIYFFVVVVVAYDGGGDTENGENHGWIAAGVVFDHRKSRPTCTGKHEIVRLDCARVFINGKKKRSHYINDAVRSLSPAVIPL